MFIDCSPANGSDTHRRATKEAFSTLAKIQFMRKSFLSLRTEVQFLKDGIMNSPATRIQNRSKVGVPNEIHMTSELNSGACTSSSYPTWPIIISSKLKFRFHLLVWLLIPTIMFITQYVLVRVQATQAYGLQVFAIYLGLMGYWILLIPYNSGQVEKLFLVMRSLIKLDDSSYASWQIEKMRHLFSVKRDLYYYVFIGPAACLTLVYTTNFFKTEQPWFGNISSDCFALIAFMIFLFVGCHFLRFVIEVVIMFRAMVKLPIAISVYQHPLVSPLVNIRQIGVILFSIAIHGAISLAFIYAGIFLSPIPMSWLVVAWMIIIGLCVMQLFLLPQRDIHAVLTQAKALTLSRLATHIEEVSNTVLSDPSEENSMKLDRLYHIHDTISHSMHEWPFNITPFLTLLSATLLPICLAIIDIIKS